MPAKLGLRVVPQRKRGSAWVECAPHQALRWAVMEGKTLLSTSYTAADGDAQLTLFKSRRRELLRLQATRSNRYGPLGVRGRGKILYSSKKKD